MDKLHRDIISLAGAMTREKIAEVLNTSRATVNRCLRDNDIRTGQPRQYPQKVVEAVMNFYSHNTLAETQKQFPEITVRSIVDRNNPSNKIKYWTFSEEMAILSKLTIMPINDISKKSGRTRSSITKLSRKYKHLEMKKVNGIPYRLCKHILNDSYTPTKKGQRYMVDWIDLEKYLETKNDEIKRCVKTLSMFRRWCLDYAS